MRFALFALILIFLAQPVLACGDSWGESFTALADAFNYTAGNVEACWTDQKTGASNVRCEEVEAADRNNAFGAHYLYERNPSKSDRWHYEHGYINCTPINAKDILENLALADFAKPTEDALACNLPLLNELQKTPRSPRSMAFLTKAYEVYNEKFDELHQRIIERDQLTSANDLGKSSCTGGRVERISLPASCTDYLRNGDQRSSRIATLNEQIQLLEARIPFMADTGVKDAVENVIRTGNRSKEAVFPAYYNQLMTMRSEMDTLHSDLVAAHRGGNTYDLLPSTKRKLWAIADYDKIVLAKERLNPHLRRVLRCMHDRRNVGASRVTGAIYGASALSMILSGGASAGIIALGATARSALVTLDLAVGGVSAVRSVDSIYNSCYKGASINLTGQQCTPDQSFDFVMQRTSTATCAYNVVSGAVVLVGAGISVRALNTTAIGPKVDTSISTNLIPQKPTRIPIIGPKPK